ncbi:MAG: motility protein A [Pseudobdellovibrionaceae bacterium]
MHIATVFSFLLAISVVVIGAITSTKNPLIYMNAHAALVVLGGTFSAAAISFGLGRLVSLVRIFLQRVLGSQRDYNPKAIIEEMMLLAESYRTSSGQLPNLIETIKDPFLKEGMSALMDQVLQNEELTRIMQTRALSIYNRYHEDAIKFKALAKFPPAFGLMGAVMGMIGIMNELGNTGGGSVVGPSLALALIGTLYGVTLANFVILPVAENLLDSAREVKTKNLMITEGVSLIMQKKNPILLAEELNSFLLAKERIDWKQMYSRAKTAA